MLKKFLPRPLLQDMAVPLLAKEKPQDYLAMLDERAKTGRRLSELEQEKFGFQHAEVAGAMARGWKMPEEFALLLESHTDLESLLPTKDKNHGKIAVALSAYLPSCSVSTWTEQRHSIIISRQPACQCSVDQ